MSLYRRVRAAASTEIVREGARPMLIATLEAEVTGYIEALAGALDEHGHRLVRNGHAEARTIITAAGGIEIEAPRVDDRRVDPRQGRVLDHAGSSLLPGVPVRGSRPSLAPCRSDSLRRAPIEQIGAPPVLGGRTTSGTTHRY